MLRRQRIQHQLGVRTDHHQKVVEIVGDASGQSTDRIHLMGLLELILQPALLRDVAVVGDKMCNLSVVVAQRGNSFFRDENISLCFCG
jgi:hypothetical protein